tara:strand:- start:7148 stop:8200 length:1053 start_codon:yes stop_codon:yes gene_type:complete
MTTYTLNQLGWSPVFLQSLDLDTEDPADIARITAVHRNRYEALDQNGPVELRTAPDTLSAEERPTIGDFVLIDRAQMRPLRVITRKSLFARKTPGKASASQLIAANVDTAFIVSSCNDDLNPARLERYLAMVREAGAVPVIVLTKADLAEEPDAFAAIARRAAGGALVETLNAKDTDALDPLRVWCGTGQTIALLGSSGVGKTTLMNSLTGGDADTGAIREDDAKGRHTTRSRTITPLSDGGWIIDTPGIRELGLTEASEGLAETFEDIADLAAACRFSDCAHDAEPGCAVQAAIAAGTLNADRLARYEKLQREMQFNTETLAERRARARSTTKFHKTVQASRSERKRPG